MQLTDLIPILQVAVGPVILISGVGLLLLTMTNQLGRVINRTREFSRALRTLPAEDADGVRAQLAILLVRARVVRASIALASVSALLAACLIIALFLSAILDVTSAVPVAILFLACLGALIVSLLLFIYDVNLSLRALRLDVEE